MSPEAPEQSLVWCILISLLGEFRVLRDGMPVSVGCKAEALISHLALHQQSSTSREALLELLWPDTNLARAGQSLNSLVYSVQKQLGCAHDGAAPIVQAEGYYRLNASAGVAVDVALFTALVDEGDAAARKADMAASCAAYSQAVSLYRGDLCAGNDVAALVEREHLRARYLSALARLANHYLGQQDYDTCLQQIARLLACDPLREDAHRMAMRCYVRRGERAQALRQFRLCEASLRAEFNAAPESATLALYEQVRCGSDTI